MHPDRSEAFSRCVAKQCATDCDSKAADSNAAFTETAMRVLAYPYSEAPRALRSRGACTQHHPDTGRFGLVAGSACTGSRSSSDFRGPCGAAGQEHLTGQYREAGYSVGREDRRATHMGPGQGVEIVAELRGATFELAPRKRPPYPLGLAAAGAQFRTTLAFDSAAPSRSCGSSANGPVRQGRLYGQQRRR